MNLTKIEKSFTALFFVIVIIELLSSNMSALSSFHNIAKPLILLSLIVFFYLKGTHLSAKTRTLMLFALSLSLLGDVLLMVSDDSPNFFLGGLIAFLLSHIFYILVFLKKRNTLIKPFVFATLLIVYAVGLFYLLRNSLGDMLIPVIFYVVVILSMAITASLRKENTPNISYYLVLIGALFFMISDSLLAVNKFYTEIPFPHLSIMSTYALAQYCIVMGILKQNN